MEINIRKCDKCGLESDSSDFEAPIIFEYYTKSIGTFHLCNKCREEFGNIIKEWLKKERTNWWNWFYKQMKG